MRAARILLLAAIALALICGGAARAATLSTAATPQRTICGADYGMQAGAAYVRDDWWNERICIKVTPRYASFTVATSVAPRPSGVVAYPYVLVAGWAWGVHAPGTSWPVRIAGSGDPRVTYRTSGDPRGVYNRSFDMWYSPKPLHTGHGTAEVMVWLTARGYSHSPVYLHPIARVRVDGIRWDLDYWDSTHRLCVPGQGCRVYTWPLIIFARPHAKYPDRVVNLKLRPFTAKAVATGLIPARDYWLSVACGAELQSGAKGLTGACSITGTTVPVIRQLGGSS